MTLFTKSPRKARTRQTLAGETRILPSGLLLPAFGGLAVLKVAALPHFPLDRPDGTIQVAKLVCSPTQRNIHSRLGYFLAGGTFRRQLAHRRQTSGLLARRRGASLCVKGDMGIRVCSAPTLKEGTLSKNLGQGQVLVGVLRGIIHRRFFF